MAKKQAPIVTFYNPPVPAAAQPEQVPSEHAVPNRNVEPHIEPSQPEAQYTAQQDEVKGNITVEEPAASWTPQPDEWFSARVVTASARYDYWFAELSNGEKVFIHAKHIQPQWAAHTCLRVGDEISVRLEPNIATNVNRSSQWKAIEVALHTPREQDREA